MKIADFSKLTFIIPVKMDSSGRAMNLHYVLERLNMFKCNIIVVEHSYTRDFYNENFLKFDKFIKNGNLKYVHINTNSHLFHKAHAINCAAGMCETNYFALYDADVIFEHENLMQAYDLIRQPDSDFIYPYSGVFINLVMFDYDCDFESDIAVKNCQLLREDSPGGCFFAKVNSFIAAGMMNENFISWGYEDDEFLYRIKKLGFNVQRLGGECYHIDHYRTYNSCDQNPHYENNINEFNRLKELSLDELKKEISTWQWKKDYYKET